MAEFKMYILNYSLCYVAIIPLLLLITSVKYGFTTSISSSVHIREEKPEGSFVVNVAELFKADKLKLSRRKFRFKMLSEKLKTVTSEAQHKPTSWVKLDSETGVMTTSRKFDRDMECTGANQCVVHIQVIMLPQTSFTFLDLDLVIDDVNDNPPTFDRDVINVKISENWQTGETYNLDAFEAKDIDAGNNSRIHYELSSNGYFSLKQSTAVGGLQHLQLVLNNKLDHEKDSEINMILSAIDGGNPAMRSQVTVKVSVVDVNDNSPKFDQEEYRITLIENSAPGMLIDTISAHDADSGAMGTIRYHISTRNNKLARELLNINSRNGELRLKERVDREKHDKIRILIEARDSDITNQRIGETWLVVAVEDVNDNSPIINTVFILHAIGDTVYISESEPKGTYLLRISATDADSGDNGKVDFTMETNSLCDGDSQQPATFVLYSDGLVATSRDLDRETCHNYIITISACDRGNPAKCSKKEIKVAVLDENEHAPKFRASTQRVTVLEDSPPGTLVTTVRAYDADSEGGEAVFANSKNEIMESKNGVVQYFITSGGRGPFSLNRNTGSIRLIKSLDRETKNEWKITVTARDGAVPSSLESSCVVIITVGDINDNAPRFFNPDKNNSLIYASTVEKRPIMKLMAKDRDANKNGEIRFKLLSEKQNNVNISFESNSNTSVAGAFVLNPTTGELKLNFSRQNVTSLLGIHILNVQAFDLGTPRKSSNITIRVSVVDTPIAHLKPGDLTAAGQDDPMLLAVCIGSGIALLLVLIATIWAVRCHKTKKESKSYSLPKEDDEHNDEIHDIISLGTHVSERVELATEMECGNKSRITSTTKLMEDRPSSRSESVSKLPHSDMGYLTVTRPSLDVASPSHSDGDSGRGDSETDGTCYNKIQKKTFHIDPSTSSTPNHLSNELGVNCTEQCKILGHSDSCWMPLIRNSNSGTSSREVNSHQMEHSRRLGSISEHSSASNAPNSRSHHPHQSSHNMRDGRSPSIASNIDEIESLKRTNIIANRRACGPRSPTRIMTPSPLGCHATYSQPILSSNQQQLSASCLMLPRSSVALDSNLLLPHKKYVPSGRVTNFSNDHPTGNLPIFMRQASSSASQMSHLLTQQNYIPPRLSSRSEFATDNSSRYVENRNRGRYGDKETREIIQNIDRLLV
ncbi:protocadherin beta-11-like isoform X2 [Styela clava]